MAPEVDVSGKHTAARQAVDDARAKYAMLSVYYASIDDQFTVSGAPSIAIPPEVKPLPLAEALEILAEDPDRLAKALWQLVRHTPIHQADQSEARYPKEIEPYLSATDQLELDEYRIDYRRGASLVAACLRACHHDDRPLFDALRGAIQGGTLRQNDGFKEVVRLLFNEEPDAFTSRVADNWSQTWHQINDLEQEVGTNIASYVEDLAATAAYQSFIDERSQWDNQTKLADLTVYPVSSVIKQSTEELWTMATVTTLATGNYEDLLTAADPAHWHDGSDVIQQSDYVRNPMLPEQPDPSPPTSAEFKALLFEVAAMTWGDDVAQQAEFRNVLNVARKVEQPTGLGRPSVKVDFSLCRSISSDVLWDHRSGGITMNEGFLGISPLGQKSWRITSRKLLQFSDRTPYSGGRGLTDFGQMLNYLAPAALSWWVETETYSLGQRASRRRRAMAGNQPTQTDGSEDGAP